MAGVDMHMSSSASVLVCRILNSLPVSMTKVTPSSLRQKILPPYAQGEAVKALPSGMRCFL